MPARSASRLPVTVVAGPKASGKSRLISQLRAARPPGQRWALLSNSLVHPPGEAGLPAMPADEYFQLTGGCACCLTGPVFRATLVRLLRAGPWDHLHIEVEAGGHPHRLVDQLRSPPFDQHLDVQRLLLTLSEAHAHWYRSHPVSSEGRAALEFATDFLLQNDAGAVPAASVCAWLQAAEPWPRLAPAMEGRHPQAIPDPLAELPGWQLYSASEAAETPGSSALIRRWPANAGAPRRPIMSVLAALADDPAVSGLQALVRTSRAWYCWRFGLGQGVGPLAFDTGSRWVEAETGWRLDNRLCVWLRDGSGHGAVDRHLQALEQALQAP